MHAVAVRIVPFRRPNAVVVSLAGIWGRNARIRARWGWQERRIALAVSGIGAPVAALLPIALLNR